MITFEEIDVDEAISYIFTTSDFPILKNYIEDEEVYCEAVVVDLSKFIK